MRDKKDTPIYSARDNDYEARDEISDFVIALAGQIDELQDVELSGDFEPLRILANKLACDAEGFGFQLLAEMALQVAAACDERSPEVAQDAMIEMTEVARRVRLGHRGAA